MGGRSGIRTDNIFNAITDTVRVVATAGIDNANEDDLAEPLEEMVTKKKATAESEKEIKLARDQQGAREAAIADRNATSESRKKSDQLRARQRSSTGQGRSSTILTSALGSPNAGAATGGKTLLGS